LFSFFTPFVTCNSFTSQESITVTYSSIVIDSSTSKSNVDSNVSVIQSENSKIFTNTSNDDNSFLKDLYFKLFYPTDNSISGIGSIFIFPILFGQVVVGLSFLLSLFLIFPWTFLKSKRRRLYFIGLNAAFITAFIITGLLAHNVSFQWGVWTTLVLIIANLLNELKAVR